jgi:nicotinamide-nucleotide amidase
MTADAPRRAAVVAVGNEVVQGLIINRNAAWLAAELGELGFDVIYHLAAGDREDDLARRLQAALAENLLVVTTGGIGPTVDDRTREAAARAMGARLVLDHDVLAHLMERYAALGRPFPEGSEKQCMRPEGSRLVANAFGTASCFLARRGEGGIAALPGVPREMEGVWREELRPALIDEFGLARRWYARELRVFGVPESELNNGVRDLLEHSLAEGAILVDDAVIRLRWRVLADDVAAANAVIGPILADARARLGDLVFGEGDETLEAATVRVLSERGLTAACAESCTGGMVAHLLTNVPGSSDVLLESAVVYSNEAKTRLLGVRVETLEAHGAVSRETALEMVNGLANTGADIRLAVTGIAGPGGGSADKPVGTVWLAAAMGGETRAWRLRVPGDRALVKWRTARCALNAMRLAGLQDRLPEKIAPWVSPP